MSCHLLLKMARMDMDCNLKKLGQPFFKLLCCACKNNQKMLRIVLSDDIICLISSLYKSTGVFCVICDFITELT